MATKMSNLVAVSADRRRAEFLFIALTFVALGLNIGVWAVLLADLTEELDLSTGELGLGLTALSTTGIVGLFLGGRIIDRLGRRAILVFGIAGTGLLFVALGIVPSYPWFLAVSFAGGLATSFFDLAINSCAGDFERVHDVKKFTLFHAIVSASAATAALASGTALTLGADFEWIYGAAGLLLIAIGIVSLRGPLPHHIQGGHAEASEARDGRGQPIWKVEGVLLAAGLIVLAFTIDSGLESFSSIYLRDVLEAGPFLASVALAAFHTAGMIGRLSSNGIINRVGERGVILLGGTGSIIGLAIISATPYPAVAAVGYLLVGISQSPVAPLAFSLGSRASATRAGQAVAFVTAAGYSAFLIAPSFIGWLAEATSLRLAIALMILNGIGIVALAYRKLRTG
jgi:MFS family permease